MLSNRKKGVAFAVLGMAGLLAGRKKTGLGLFGRGFSLLEKEWRKDHPEFDGSLSDRWDLASKFYEQTHRNATNRWLHLAGIPMIVAGAAGLLAFKPFRPAWTAAAGAFTVGWGLNIVGHAVFEKNAPAFADDPLSFVMGPVWDAKNLFSKRQPSAQKADLNTDPPLTTHVAASA